MSIEMRRNKQRTQPKKQEGRRNLVIPDPIWRMAEERASAANRSVSNYLQTLVLKDAGKFEAAAA